MDSERRYGQPKTEEQRKQSHKAKFGTSELPPRGTGLKTWKKGLARDSHDKYSNPDRY